MICVDKGMCGQETEEWRSVRLGEEMSDENVGGTDGWDASD